MDIDLIVATLRNKRDALGDAIPAQNEYDKIVMNVADGGNHNDTFERGFDLGYDEGTIEGLTYALSLLEEA